MIRFSEIVINSSEDYLKLKKCVSASHIDEDAISKLQTFAGTKCTKLLIEYPYYDKDYLSNYYSHYAQKFKKYDKACYRIHFQSAEEYYGYTILRPTPEGTKFGKTYLVPEFLVKNCAFLMLSNFLAHIHGQQREIACFPWKRQESDISCCAHTATWVVLKYFGNKYKNYCDTTIGEIVDKVKNENGRKTPTLGLTPYQVSEIFKAYNFSPIIIEKGDDYSFYDSLLAYIESGIPIVGFFNTERGKHSVAIIGHGKVNVDLIDEEALDDEECVVLSTRLVDSVYVMDDRCFPYIEVSKALPTIATSENGVEYGMNQLCHAVIPLYNRMLLTYSDVYYRMIAWVKSKIFDFGNRPVCRIYITSSNSLKDKANKNKTMSKMLCGILLSLSMPRFVWCVDFAENDLYKARKTSGRIIIDATAATMDKEPWILMHDSKKIHYKDYDETEPMINEVRVDIKPYDMYINNLKEITCD